MEEKGLGTTQKINVNQIQQINISVFSDFDGTIVKQDIGNELFIHYGQFQPFNSMLKAGELEIKEYWKQVCSTLQLPDGVDSLNPDFFREFIKQFDIDQNFKTFYNFCIDNGISINIISDGFINYIQPVLAELEIENAKIFANELKIVSNNNNNNDNNSNNNKVITPHFYGASESCECMCASCKRNSVITQTPPDNIIVYIGDGHSDLCAAEHSDIIFAKSQLSAFLNEKRIPHYNFSNFFDVYRIFSNIVKTGKYKVRHQAHLNRKRACEWE